MCTSKTVVEHPASYSFGYGFSCGWDATSSYMERVEECRKEVGAEVGVRDGYCLPAPGAAPAGFGQMRVPVHCRQPVEKRSSISPRSPFCGWPALSFLHKSLLQFMFSGREKNLCGEPWFQPRAEQGPPKDQFSFSAPAFHLCLPLAGERFCTWTLQSGPQCWELLST